MKIKFDVEGIRKIKTGENKENLESGSISPDDAINELKRNIKKGFPIEVFNDDIKKLILEADECLNFPIDFFSSSILSAVSGAIGNTFNLHFKKGWKINPCMFMCIVSHAGVNKSAPLKFALKPLMNIDDENVQEHIRNISIYEEDLKAFEREKRKSEKEGDFNLALAEPEKPVFKQIVISDATIEALKDCLSKTERGLVLHCDEFTGWINNMNRYSKGSDIEVFLESWSNGRIIKNRTKDSIPLYVKNPFINIAGTSQISKLKEIFLDGKEESGFTHRVLWVFSDSEKARPWSEKDLTDQSYDYWNNLIYKIYLYGENKFLEEVFFIPKAKQVAFNYQKELVNQSNETTYQFYKGLIAKMEQYFLRFCIVFHVIEIASNDEYSVNISENSVRSAIKVTEYFKQNAIDIYRNLKDSTPADKLEGNKKLFYESLEDGIEHKTGDLYKKAESYKLSKKVVKSLIARRELFYKASHGHYIRAL